MAACLVLLLIRSPRAPRRAPCPWALVALALLVASPARAQNPVQLENLNPGTADWQIDDANRVQPTSWSTAVRSAAEIEGYASLTSVDRGDTIDLFVRTSDPTYTIEIFRIGWYGGLGGRSMLGPILRTRHAQPDCTRDPVTLMVECMWGDPYRLRIPDDWVSGFYLAKLTGIGSGKQNHILFVVREDARPSRYLFLSATNTYQAYNYYGGTSLYPHAWTRQGTKVSFNRPYDHWVPALAGSGEFLVWEASMVRFLEREGYDVSYATNLDAHVRPGMFLGHRALLSVGHDEYWSWEMRQNAEWARDRCVNLGFFSGNSAYWQIRYEASALTAQPNRTIVAYKDSALRDDPLARDPLPSNDHLITTQWRNPRPGFPVARPEDALLGVMFAFWWTDDDLVIVDLAHPLFDGVSSTVLPALVGYEADRMFANAPPGTERLARSPVTVLPDPDLIYDCSDAAGNCFSDMTLYRWRGGPWVFAAGTIQWSWGLDDLWVNDRLNPDAQQITRNVLELLATSCAIDPSIITPPPTTADIGVTGDLSSSGTVVVVECLRDPVRCWWASRRVSPAYPTTLLYDRSEMQEIQPIDYQVPEPPSTHELVGSLYDIQLQAQFEAPVWLTLSYDEAALPAGAEANLDALALRQGPNGPYWEVVEARPDLAANVMLVKLPFPSLVSLAVGPGEADADQDGIGDGVDNCPADHNPGQSDIDADGLGDACDLCPAWISTNSDRDGNGVGDECECGDQNRDGVVNVEDILAISFAIFNPHAVHPLCDATNDGLCNVGDILAVNAKIFGADTYCARWPAPIP